MAKYRLGRAFWDGQTMHKAGAVVDFEPGTQPRMSKPLEEPKPELSEEEEAAAAAAKLKASATKTSK